MFQLREMILVIVIYLSVTRVLQDLDPCYPTGGPCTKYQDCPKNWACVDDSVDHTKPDEVHGICVGNERIKGCDVVQKGKIYKQDKIQTQHI